MLRVALTGGIGSGKSYVAQRLRDLGIPVVDADVLARLAVAPGSAVLAAIVQRFGAVLVPDGGLDRPALAGLVFADAQARRDLEAIVHPVVRAEIEAFFERQAPDTPMAVADIPLLYETGRAGDFDAVVVAACSPETQVARVMKRDGITAEAVRQRMAAQLPLDGKAARADYVIETGGTFAETDAAVTRVLAALAARAR